MLEILNLVLILCVGILFSKTGSLKKQLNALEDRLTALGDQPQELMDTRKVVAETTVENPESSDKSTSWTPPEGKPKARLKRLVAAPESSHSSVPENPRAFVFRADLYTKAIRWLMVNWYYALAAVSLAFAGIFLIQYSVESGLLSPPLRVLGALVMGGALILGAEFLRRKGSDEAGNLAYLPSTFAAGGFITLFAAIWGAYALYGLISPLLSFVLLALIGIGAIICGWFYGPLVSAVGTVGAIATPFLLGGESENTHLLMPYFAAITAGSLFIDTIKRWAWLSTLAIVSGLGATTLIFLATEARPTYLATMIGFVLLATVIPMKSLYPRHNGPALLAALKINYQGNLPRKWPDFPPRLVLATLLAASAACLLTFSPEISVFWIVLIGVGILLLLTLVWMANAPGLEDAALLPATALLALAALASPEANPALWSMAELGEDALAQDVIRPILALGIVALLVSAIAGWRSFSGSSHPIAWGAGAVTFAPLMAALLEVLWNPVMQLGRPLWAICLITVAALMTWLTTQYSRKDGENRLRTSIALCAAIVMIAFAIVALLSSAALTIALALTTAITAYISTRQKLPLLGHLVTVGAIVVSARLVVNPGIFWALGAPLWEICFAFIPSIALLAAAKRLFARTDSSTDMVLHSAVWSLGGIFATILLFRLFDTLELSSDFLEASLLSAVWLILCFTQFYRLKANSRMQWVRLGLGSIYLAVGVLLLGLSLTLLNPLFGGLVKGPPVFNGLLIAYGLPALILGGMALRLTHLNEMVLKVFAALSVGLAAFTIGVLIRHFWRRPDIQLPSIEPAELYSYTIAMMICAGMLLYGALSRKSTMLRRAALIALGLTAAKVFLIDSAGLTGLIRVFAFLGLGLTLAGLAWLDRRFGQDVVLTPAPSPDTGEGGESNDTTNAG